MRFDICKNPAFMQSASTRKQRSNKWYIQTLEDNTTITTDYANILEYSLDDKTYIPMQDTVNIPTAGQKIYFNALGTLEATVGDDTGDIIFQIIEIDKTFNAYGLLEPFHTKINLFGTKIVEMTSFSWFPGNKIVDASGLIIDITNYLNVDEIDGGVFQSCQDLKYPPKLPSLTVPENAYANMFNNCQSLIAAPDLPATNVNFGSYSAMFRGCISLRKTGIITGHPSSTMFWGCSSLSEVTCLADDINSENCQQWLNGVSPTGTFIKAAGVEWPTGVNGIPDGWTVQEYAGDDFEVGEL